MPQKMRVSNQREYNEFLKKRGNVFHFVNQAIENWYENSPKVADAVLSVNKKIIKIVSLPRLYCKTKKYFQLTSCIADTDYSYVDK